MGPYLKNPHRLADILAAIQVLGTYEFAARDLDKWANRLGRKPKSGHAWDVVFDEHPEFFTKDDTGKYSLIWRRSFNRDYDTITKKEIEKEERNKLAEEEKNGHPSRLSRRPLDNGQIEHLCNLAINLHEREIQHRQEMRWWITIVLAIITTLISVWAGS